MPVSVSKSPVTSQEMPELCGVFTSPTSPMKRRSRMPIAGSAPNHFQFGTAQFKTIFAQVNYLKKRMPGGDQNFYPRCQYTALDNVPNPKVLSQGLFLCALLPTPNSLSSSWSGIASYFPSSQSTQLSFQNSPPNYDSPSCRFRLGKLSW